MKYESSKDRLVNGGVESSTYPYRQLTSPAGQTLYQTHTVKGLYQLTLMGDRIHRLALKRSRRGTLNSLCP